MYAEDDYFQLSALQHYLFCPRQCALAYLELTWIENLFTAEGRILHERVHEAKKEKRNELIRARGLWLSSSLLGISGQADLVEFIQSDVQSVGCSLPGYKGKWLVYPVEYKRGRPKKDFSDEVQLCAQAMCLEEMLDVAVPEGALFYGRQKQRKQVLFDDQLRQLTRQTCLKIHELFKTRQTPPAEYSKKCISCSLLEICMPKKCQKSSRVQNYIKKILEEM